MSTLPVDDTDNEHGRPLRSLPESEFSQLPEDNSEDVNGRYAGSSSRRDLSTPGVGDEGNVNGRYSGSASRQRQLSTARIDNAERHVFPPRRKFPLG